MGYGTFRLHREALARQPKPAPPVVRDPFAELQAAYDTLRAENDALKARLAETEALLATATAPPPETQQERRNRR